MSMCRVMFCVLLEESVFYDLLGLKNSKTHSLSYLKCHLTSCACGQAQNLGSVHASQKQDQRPALLLLKPEQDFLHFNFHEWVFVCALASNSLRPHGLEPAKLPSSWDSLGKNTRVGCHVLLQGIFPTQESNPHLLPLLNWQSDSLPLSHLGSPFNFHNSILIILIPGACYLTQQRDIKVAGGINT